MTKVYEGRLDETSVKTLRRLIGQTVSVFLSPGLHVHGAMVHSLSLSLRLPMGGFILFTNRWFNTPKQSIDCWELQAREADEPMDIPRDEDGQFRAHSAIWVLPRSPIVEVCIFEADRQEGAGEDVENAVFDATILFRQESGHLFCIEPLDDISGQIQFTESSTHISQTIHRRLCRLSISHDSG